MCHLKDKKIEAPAEGECKAIVGEEAPDFTLESDEGKSVTLSGLRGHKVVLYFYPKDNTSGCTVEAKNFEAELKEFQTAGYQIYGVSRDSLKSHANFRTKAALTFPLLSDPDSVVSKLYGVLKMKSMYGRQYLGIVRSTFVIDENGILVDEFRNVKASTHVADLMKKLGIKSA